MRETEKKKIRDIAGAYILATSTTREQTRAEKSISVENARQLTVSALVQISAIPPDAFPEDNRKEVRVIIREIAERIRKLRLMLPK